MRHEINYFTLKMKKKKNPVIYESEAVIVIMSFCIFAVFS